MTEQATKPLKLDPRAPRDVAKSLMDHKYLDPISRAYTLRSQNGTFFEYEDGIYREVGEQDIRQIVYEFLGQAVIANGRDKGKPFKPTKYRVNNVIDALKAYTNMNANLNPPCWLNNRESRPVAKDVIAVANGLLHVPTRTLERFTPEFFTFNKLTFDFDPTAERPARWWHFLDEIWPDDHEAKQALQEFIGYTLTSSTRFQKILLLVGPKRSGKGTIVRIIQELLGVGNFAGPTLQGLSQHFGLSLLIGKVAAFISDARISSRTDTTIVKERLLTMSGEDSISIPRKYRDDWTGRLYVKFILTTNELPKIEDVSGAFASRFLILEMKNSFYGREDTKLSDKLSAELPGILLWALDGLDSLNQRGKFLQPESGKEAIREFEEISSPIKAFLSEECELGPTLRVDCEEAFYRWEAWCKRTGHQPGNGVSFGRALRSEIPALQRKQHRVDGRRVGHYIGLHLLPDVSSPDVMSDQTLFNEELNNGVM